MVSTKHIQFDQKGRVKKKEEAHLSQACALLCPEALSAWGIQFGIRLRVRL